MERCVVTCFRDLKRKSSSRKERRNAGGKSKPGIVEWGFLKSGTQRGVIISGCGQGMSSQGETARETGNDFAISPLRASSCGELFKNLS